MNVATPPAALSCVVADDEAPVAARIARLAVNEGLDVASVCGSGREALDAISRHAPAIAFLDIRMPGLSGLDVMDRLRTVPDPPACVLVTAHGEHAVAAFALAAVDYLLKPVSRERFAAAVERARSTLATRDAAAQLERLRTLTTGRAGGRPLERIALRDGGRVLQFAPRAIVRAEAADDYVVLHVERDGSDAVREQLVSVRLAALERLLPDPPFRRVHRSHLVNLDRVDEAASTGDGRLALQLAGARVPVSRSYAATLRAVLSERAALSR